MSAHQADQMSSTPVRYADYILGSEVEVNLDISVKVSIGLHVEKGNTTRVDMHMDNMGMVRGPNRVHQVRVSCRIQGES